MIRNSIFRRLLAGSSVLAISSVSAQSTSNTRNNNADGNWTDPLYWTGDALYAQGANHTATFGSVITDNRIVTVDAPITIGNMTAKDTNTANTSTGTLTLTVIPEPSTPLIGAFGMLLMLRRCRR